MLFRIIFFELIGILGLIGVVFGPTVNFSDSQNVVLNNLFRASMLNFSLLMLIIPLLMKKGIISASYYSADKYDKAKSELIIISLGLPGIVMLSYVFFATPDSGNMVLVFILLIAVYRYLECIYLVFYKRK